jgi:hypothetical protein
MALTVNVVYSPGLILSFKTIEKVFQVSDEFLKQRTGNPFVDEKLFQGSIEYQFI